MMDTFVVSYRLPKWAIGEGRIVCDEVRAKNRRTAAARVVRDLRAEYGDLKAADIDIIDVAAGSIGVGL